MKRLIIFDFFGVLGNELSPKWFKKHFEEKRALELKEHYFVPADNGVYTFKETLEHMANDLGFKYEDILDEFKANVKPNYELFDYILKLKENKDNTIALLSNAAEGIFDMLYPVDFKKYFDKAFISSEHHMQKPEARFYLLCKNSFGINFDEVYMIDDNYKNIKDLDSIGIKGIQYFDNKSLFDVLDNLK